MGNCKDCNHWHNAKQHPWWNTCQVPEIVKYNEKISDTGFAYYVESDGIVDFGIKTGPMFGCVKFEEK